MKKKIFVEVISIISIILFLYTVISKLAEYSVFREQIALSPILEPFADVLTWLLPLVEFLIIILLLLPKWKLYGLYAACTLMVLFSMYILVLFKMDEKLPCSCGGIIEQLPRTQHLILNIGLALLQAIGIKFQKQIEQTLQMNY